MKRNSCLNGEKKDWAKQEYVDMDFDMWIYELARKRFAAGKDKKLLSFRIMTRAILRMSIAKEIESILLTAEIKDDRWKDEE